jgi:hypothetical protein
MTGRGLFAKVIQETLWAEHAKRKRTQLPLGFTLYRERI